MLRLARAILFIAIGGVIVYTHAEESGKGSQPPEILVAYQRGKLDELTPELQFDQTPFEQVIDALRASTGAKLVVDWIELERAGVARDVPITLRSVRLPLCKALDVILDSAGGRVIPDYVPGEEGEILITTREAAMLRPPTARLYDVRDLVDGPLVSRVLGEGIARQFGLSDIEMVRGAILYGVTPDGWDTGKMLSQVVPVAGHLLVIQSRENQLKVELMLHNLRKMVAMSVRGEKPTQRSFESLASPEAEPLKP